MKKMAVDLGRVRIGISLSDLLGILASPYETYRAKTAEQDLIHIADIAQKNNVDEIIVGLPLNMDGSESEMSEYAREFCERLKEKTSAKIILEDERLTSLEADEILTACDKRGKKRKELIDQVAATLILQGYLDRRHKEN